jgi:RNA polymerase sigma factor (sigma-70 family)
MALLSDDRLAQRATKGDERAFAAIYRRYHQDLYRFCLAIVGSSADAQDALQNTMVKVLGALPGEKRHIQLKPWLYRIAHNEAIELLRKRRDTVEIDPDLHTTGAELADTAATRERLRRLLADVGELPDRQRAALVMRELAGLDFEQIGTTLQISGAAARQTVYEARLGLGQMERGREMSCEHVMRELSDADGRVARRREIRAHLRACPDCRAFREAIGERRHGFAAIAPLPLAASAGLLHGLLGGANAGAAAAGNGMGGGLAGTVAAGAGKTAATSAIVKSAATVAVVAVVGTTAADRSGMVDIGLPGGEAPIVRGAGPGAEKGATGQAPQSSAQQARKAGGGADAAGAGAGPALHRKEEARGSARSGGADAARPAQNGHAAATRGHHGRSKGAQDRGHENGSASHGQQTATANGPGRGQGAAKANHGASKAQAHSAPDPATHPNQGPRETPPAASRNEKANHASPRTAQAPNRPSSPAPGPTPVQAP